MTGLWIGLAMGALYMLIRIEIRLYGIHCLFREFRDHFIPNDEQDGNEV